jgi:predicted DNA binding CopG/RHH family protein
MKKKLKPIPKFKDEDEERDFWATADTSEYFDWSKAIVNPKFPNLKFSTKPVTVRLPQSLLDDMKMAANKRDVPYQSLMKVWLAEKLQEEKMKENYLMVKDGGSGKYRVRGKKK